MLWKRGYISSHAISIGCIMNERDKYMRIMHIGFLTIVHFVRMYRRLFMGRDVERRSSLCVRFQVNLRNNDEDHYQFLYNDVNGCSHKT